MGFQLSLPAFIFKTPENSQLVRIQRLFPKTNSDPSN
jgi:hypothetical protein